MEGMLLLGADLGGSCFVDRQTATSASADRGSPTPELMLEQAVGELTESARQGSDRAYWGTDDAISGAGPRFPGRKRVGQTRPPRRPHRHLDVRQQTRI